MSASPVATAGTLFPVRPELGADLVSRETVLLVEDDEALGRLFAVILERANLRVLRARDGAQCLQLFEENRSDVALVLMDCTLPDVHGGNLCHRPSLLNAPHYTLTVSGFISKSCVISTLLLSMIEAEQYFSADNLTARST